ncbi:MAG: imidazole glycerol phosphate synthase subunit HisH [Prevotella sp.]|nr:imidazole glycerol phosphate synthase subunit HisH [Prevotella sp.]
MNVAVVKYNAGNICSVVNALRRQGVNPVVTDDERLLMSADKVVFPGQGEASSVMACLREKGLDRVIPSLRQPVLGICIGQQLMCRHSEEGDTTCLGIFDIDVKKFSPEHHSDKVPAMGWNSLGSLSSPLFSNMPDHPYVYFVHSYYVPCCSATIAVANYIHPYSAALWKDNFFATQFHPEKSGSVGEQILKNFLNL